MVEECEATWADIPIFICDATIWSNLLFLHHPFITPTISHCDVTIPSNVSSPITQPFIPTNTPCDVAIPVNVTYLTQPFIPTNTPCDVAILVNVTYLTQPFVPTNTSLRCYINVTYLTQPFIPTNTPCDVSFPCNVTFFTQPFIPTTSPCDVTILFNVTFFTQPFIPPTSSYCDGTISSNVSNPTQAPIPPPCSTPNVSNPLIDTLCFCPASNIPIPITSPTNSTLDKVIHASTTVINHVYVSTVSNFFYVLFSPTYATLYCIDLFPKVSNWMVEKYKAKWADIPILWNATIQYNISSVTQTPTTDSSQCDVTHPASVHSPPTCFTPNVSHPDIDPLCFCPASNISIPIISLTNSTTIINHVYVSTVSIVFYALFSPTYAILYGIDLFPKVTNWMVEKYNAKWADIPIDMWNATIQSNISSLTQTPSPDSSQCDVTHPASVHSPPTCFTPNVSHPDIDPLCFCPASNISISIMTSFTLDPVIQASTTFIKSVYVWTVSTMLYALHSPTNATLYCINPRSTISDWKIYNTVRNDTDYFTSTQFTRRPANLIFVTQGFNPLNTTTCGVDSAEIPVIDLREATIIINDVDITLIGHVVIFKKEFGVIYSVMDMLVQWYLWLLDNVS